MSCDVNFNTISNSKPIAVFNGSEYERFDYKENILDIAKLQFGDSDYIKFKEVDDVLEVYLNEEVFNEKSLGNKEYTIDNKSILFNVKEFVEKSINLGIQNYEFKNKEQLQDVTAEFLYRAGLSELIKSDFGIKENENYNKKEILNSLINFIYSKGIDVMSMDNYIDSYKNRNGVSLDEIALADTLNNVIALSKDVKLEDFTEEVSHFIINTSNDPRIEKLLNKINETEEWTLFNNQYREKYSQDNIKTKEEVERLVRLEILGKVFKNVLLNENKETNNFFTNLILKIWNGFKNIFNIETNDIPSVLNDLKSQILANEVENFTNNRVNDIFYSLSYQEQSIIRNAKELLNKSRTDISNLKRNLGNKEMVSDRNILSNIVSKLNILSEKFDVENFNTTLLEYMLYREQHIKDIVSKMELLKKNNIDVSSIGYVVMNMNFYTNDYRDELDSYSNIIKELGVSNPLITKSINRQKQNIQILDDNFNTISDNFNRNYISRMLDNANASEDVKQEALSKMYSSQSDLGMIRNFLSQIKNSSNPIVQAIHHRVFSTNLATENKFFNKISSLLSINKKVFDLSVQKIGDEYTGHFFHMYNPLEINKYKDLKYENFAKEIESEFGVKLAKGFSKDDITLLETTDEIISNIQERLDLLDKEIVDKTQIKPMIDEFYERRKSMSKDTINILSGINQEKYSILDKYIQENKIDFKNISKQDKEQLSILERKKKQIASLFNIAGVLKTGDELRIAKEMQSYNDTMKSYFEENRTEDDIQRNADAFEKFNNEFEIIKNSASLTDNDKLEWLKENGYIRFDDDFYLEFGSISMKKRDEEILNGIKNNIANEIGIDKSEYKNLSDDEFIELIQRYKLELVKPYRTSNFISEYNINSMPIDVLLKLRTIQTWLNTNTESNESFNIEIDIDSAIQLISNGSIVYGYNGITKSWETVDSTNYTKYTKFKAPKTIKVPSSQFNKDLLEAQANGVENEFLNQHTTTDKYNNRIPNFYYSRSIPNMKYDTVLTEVANGRQVQTKMKITVNLMGIDTDIIVSPNSYWFDRTNVVDLSNPLFNKDMAGKTIQYVSGLSDNIGGVDYSFSFLDDNYLDYFGIDRENIWSDATKNIDEFEQYKYLLNKKYIEDKEIGAKNKYFELPQVRRSVENKITSLLYDVNNIKNSFNELFIAMENDDIQGELEEQEELLTSIDANNLFRNKKGIEYKNDENKWIKINKITYDKKNSNHYINGDKNLILEQLSVKKASSKIGISKKTFNVRKSIPLYYQKRLDPKDVSTDLKSSLTKYILMSTNYQEKSKMMYEVVQLNEGLKKQKYDKLNGDSSNEYKAVDSFINRELFGAIASSDTIISLGKVNLSRVKINRSIARYIQRLNLAFKSIVPITGASSAFVQAIVESYGGRYFDFHNYRFAHSVIMKDANNILSDIGEINYNSNINKLTRLIGFDEPLEFTETIGQNKIRRTLSNPGFLLYRVSDYLPKVFSTIAVSDNYRLVQVFNDNDEPVYRFMNKSSYMSAFKIQEKDGRDVPIKRDVLEKEWSELRSFAKTYKIDDNGNLSFDFNGTIINANETLSNIALDVSQSYTNMTGNLNKTDKPYMYDFPELQFLGLHRGWLFNALGVWFKKDRINISSGEYERGLAYELFSNKSKFFKGFITAGAGLLDDETLTENQKYALRKSIMLSYMTISTLAIAILANAKSDDDEDDYAKAYLAFVSTKLLQETFSSSPIGILVELYSSWKDPMGSINSVTTLVSNAPEILNDDLVKSGKYKGKTKRLKTLMQSIPIIKNMYEHKGVKESNDYFRNKISYFNFLISEKKLKDKEYLEFLTE